MDKKTGKECGICASTVAYELVEGRKLGLKTSKLYKKFVSNTGYKGDSNAFYMMLYRHISAGHQALNPQKQEVPKSELTLENYAEQLLSKAMGDPEMMEGKKITHQAVIAAQKVLNDRNKIRQEESVMKQAFLKLFRGKGVELPKEILDELQTIQQSNTN